MHKKIRVIFLIVVMLAMVFGSNTVLAVGGYISGICGK